MLLLSDADLRARAAIASGSGPLAALAQSLAAELEPLLQHGDELMIPREKALLSRAGGRCPRDGVYLEFDPFSPNAHRCPICGETFRGVEHDRFWIYWYQLWLAERAVHGALLAALGNGDRYAMLARRILERYAEQYLTYSNSDNVLGPTRVFFSTYLESIWLLQLAVATDLLEAYDPDAARTLGARVRDRIIEPSCAIIAVYDEGRSNRQVWNNAALLAANRLLGRTDDAHGAVFGPSGISSHLSDGLLPDGTWYEGENYHLFAHRGLWYGVVMAERAGMELPEPLVSRFQEGFATPFLTALPDFTLPSRRDSQYAISLRQPRFAELAELGLARTVPHSDARLVGALQRLYEDTVPRGDTGRSRSTADVERNLPPTSLSRADLGWRSLLYARAALPPLVPSPPESVLLAGQGIAVLRRQRGGVYVALDYGTTGGGHGHPDRLNVLLSDGDTRWLDDMGTGSYVDSSLHWYRSTLAHNAPLFDGKSQQPVDGALLAFDEQGDAGWVSAVARGLAPGVTAIRTLVVMPDYLLEELTWTSESDVVADLPMHLDARLTTKQDVPIASGPLTGGTGLEDGFDFLASAELMARSAGKQLEVRAQAGARTLTGWIRCMAAADWWRAVAPGPPGSGERPFLLVRSRGRAGSVHAVWSWSSAVRSATTGDETIVELADGTRDLHQRTDRGWHVEQLGRSRRGSIALGGIVAADYDSPVARTTPDPSLSRVLRPGHSIDVDLGEAHYRRSEESWSEAGRPTARVSIARSARELQIDVSVAKPDALTFVSADAENRYDNEQPDVNGDGVQLYVADESHASAWLLVPEGDGSRDGRVRTRPITGWTDPWPMVASWERTADGYCIRVTVAVEEQAASRLALDVLVNEKPPGRERRRGQLVLSGARGEFVYLRGDRHDRERMLRLNLSP